MTAELFIIRGLCGSGKTTLANKLLQEGKADLHYEADQYFEDAGVYNFDATQLFAAHNWCKRMVYLALHDRRTVVVSNTFTTQREVDPYLEIAKYFKVPVEIITCAGDYGSVHNVPEHTLLNMKRRWVPVLNLN